MCFLGGRAFRFDSRASGRAYDCQTIALEFVADDTANLIGKLANGGPAVLLNHPAHRLPLRGAALRLHG